MLEGRDDHGGSEGAALSLQYGLRD